MNVKVGSNAPAAAIDLDKFKKLLLRSCGHSFENDRERALSKAVGRRMEALDIGMHEIYYALLCHDHNELCMLTEMLTVNETYFFREPEHLSLAVDQLLPEFIAARNQAQVRILSAGCSTGEEPYSLAILLRERFGNDSGRLFTITGVDIDSTVIDSAKNAVYGTGSFRGMDPALLERYFEPHPQGKFRVSEVIRKLVGFEVVNLLGDSYPERMRRPDIILYRNVSIYFPGEVQREIFGKLSELLVDGGCILVGAAETMHHDLGILSLVKQNSLFYYRKMPPIVFQERRALSRYSSTPVTKPGVPPQAAPVYTAGHGQRHTKSKDRDTHENRSKMLHPPGQSDVRERFDAAIKLAHEKQHDKALAILDAIIEEDNTFEKAHSLKGSLLLNASLLDEARTVCKTILDRDSLSLVAYLMLGMIARQQGDEDDAMRRFREAIYIDSLCWPAHFYSAEIAFAKLDKKRARSSYEAAFRILQNGSQNELGQAFFPITFNVEQFIVICRHKLSLLDPKNDTGTVTRLKGIKHGI